MPHKNFIMETLTNTQPPAVQENPQQEQGMESRFSHIPGWGMDADPSNNPTYPMKHWDGSDHQRLNYERAPQQPVDMETLKSIERPTLTRVFGSSVPPSGLSGVIRRFAYKYSEATLTHWFGLIFADRVNVVEGRLSDLAQGKIPNIWKERGWNSEWKYNRKGMVTKMAAGVLAATIIVALARRKKNSSWL